MAEATPLPAQTAGRVVYISSIVLAIISTVLVCLRLYLRWVERLIWWDDGFILVGLLSFLASIGAACRSSLYGLGIENRYLSEEVRIEGSKYLMIWGFLYTVCLVVVKCSICLTLIRLSETMKYVRITIYVSLLASVIAFLITFVGALTICGPVEANWDVEMVIQGAAVCASESTALIIAYVSVALTLLTDIACAIIPAVILWGTQLKRRTKTMVVLLLSFGSIASVSTILRTPYIRYYMAENLLYWMSRTVLWSNFETGVGLIAGSLPVIPKMIRCYKMKRDTSAHPNALGLVTFGGAPVKPGYILESFDNPTDTGHSTTTVQARRRSREWGRLEECIGTHYIHAQYSVEVQRSEASETQLSKGGE